MNYTLYCDAKKLWRWNLKAANGEIIASGESYKRKADCLMAIYLVSRGSKLALADLEHVGFKLEDHPRFMYFATLTIQPTSTVKRAKPKEKAL